MTPEKKWYAIYTKPRCERRVADQLAGRQIEHFCPVVSIARPGSKRKAAGLTAVFATYIFVLIPESDQLVVKNIPDVVHFVYWLGSPAPIAAEEIDAMRFLADDKDRLCFEKIQVTPVARRIVTQGPFLHWGKQNETAEEKSVTVYLPGLGVQISAAFSMSRAEKLSFFRSAVIPLMRTDSTAPKIVTGS